MSTTNGQKFVYVPYEYIDKDRMFPPFHILKTTENTLRSIPRASIDKPPSIKPPINFKLSKIGKEYYNSRTANTKTSKKKLKKWVSVLVIKQQNIEKNEKKRYV